jgi:hypothetical protein
MAGNEEGGVDDPITCYWNKNAKVHILLTRDSSLNQEASEARRRPRGKGPSPIGPVMSVSSSDIPSGAV